MRAASTFRVIEPDTLLTTCWCERDVVHVPRRLVLAGRTLSCGRPGCKESERA